MEQPSLFRLPFYDRILFIGLGGLADEAENNPGAPSSLPANALTSTLYAAVTDLFLYRAVKQQALDEFRRRKRKEQLRRRRQFHHGGDDRTSSSSSLYRGEGDLGQSRDRGSSASSGVQLTPEEEATVLRLESRIRSKIKIAVLDSRRPLHGALMMRVRTYMHVETCNTVYMCKQVAYKKGCCVGTERGLFFYGSLPLRKEKMITCGHALAYTT